MAFDDLRRVASAAGMIPARAVPPGSHGRAEQVATRLGRVVEGEVLRAIPVGAPTPCPEPIGFLDGVQRHQLLAHARGILPLFAADLAVAVRERTGRRLTTVLQRRRRLLLGRPAALDLIGPDPSLTRIALPDDVPEHPLIDRDAAVVRLDAERAALEAEVAAEYRRDSSGWLIVDGSLAECRPVAADPRAIGVSKSHAVLPFAGRDLELYLGLPEGCRSAVYRPAGRGASVYSWALRLRAWEGHDVFFGLVRVEAPASEETLARADEYSRWLLAERAPISAPDARWDRLLYGIHNVEEFLRATLPVR